MVKVQLMTVPPFSATFSVATTDSFIINCHKCLANAQCYLYHLFSLLYAISYVMFLCYFLGILTIYLKAICTGAVLKQVFTNAL